MIRINKIKKKQINYPNCCKRFDDKKLYTF